MSWMAKGHRNNTIASMLCLEPKTVERHIFWHWGTPVVHHASTGCLACRPPNG
ncbi:MAG: hypothetical protein EXR49_06520 [Dehalococcoidia bacterium]|nr:hypothetical protein [Dehalococcoidia bacterium]